VEVGVEEEEAVAMMMKKLKGSLHQSAALGSCTVVQTFDACCTALTGPLLVQTT
jgi:hypothetical protein